MYISFSNNQNSGLLKKRITYHLTSASVILAFVVNLLLPAALGASQLFCEEAPFVHTNGLHAHCCTGDESTTGLSHSSCILGQICQQTLKEGLNNTAVFPSQSLQIAGTPALFTTLLNPVNNPILKSSRLQPNSLPVSEDIYLLNGAFLN